MAPLLSCAMPKKEPVPIKFPPDKELARLFARVVREASRFPGTEESRSYGTPALKVKGKILARLRSEAEGGLALQCDFEARQMLMETEPGVFYITDHYAGWPMVLIDLKKVAWEMMPDLLEQGWRMVATARLIKEFDGA